MRRLGLLVLTLAIGLGGGLGSAWLALTAGLRFGRVDIGAWTTYPRAAGLEADPYSRAALARDGALPLAVGEGAAFVATRDRAGRALDGRCTYLVSGVTPPARAWTLTAHDPAGRLQDVAAGRPWLTSSELVRRADGSFAVTVGPAVEPGNWIAVAKGARFVLTLSLYDTPVSALGGEITPSLLPTIEPGACP